MAVEYIGGSILSAVIEVLGEKVTAPEILGFFKSHKLNDALLGKLKETLNTLNGLLDDAEEKQITKPAVQRWLNDARHAVYEAEDLMEVIEYEHLRSKDIKAASRRLRNPVRILFPILNPANKRMKEMEAELQKIYEKLERLVKHKGDLRHIEGTGGWRPLSEKTTPVVDESHVYGREADKEAIMKYLLTKNNTDGANVGVIPIVGMGGVGKTTLAQLIYKDRRVDECFELKAWVWASQQFDVTRIVDDILKKINAGTCGTKEPDESLMEALKGKKLLQTLLLRECRHLMELPSNISNLVELQHLDIEGTNLKVMPPKMGKLTKLRTLQYYIVGKDSGSSMKELGKLSHIRRKLSIRNLRDVANAQDALDANLKGKKKIEKLRLIWGGNTDDTQHERDVLEKLEPSENVKQLVITGYGGTMFPGWFGKSSFSNMVELTLSGCKNCISLPPMGQLSSLEELQIKGFDEVVAVGSEFYGSDSLMEKPFKSLKILKFEGMKKWQEWNTDVAGAFPHLAKLLIAGCPELTNGLPNHLPSLLILEIRACPQLVVSIPEAPLLTEINVFDGSSGRINASVLYGGGRCLQFREYPQLKGMEQMSHVDPSSFTDVEIDRCSSFNSCRLDLLPQVSTLTVKQCLNLESLCIGERSLPALRHLTVRHCPNLVSFPRGGLAAPDLTSLVLEGCLYLKSLPENMHSLLPSLEDLQLRSLPEVDSFPEGGLPSKLHTLCIVDCIKLKVCGLQALPSLSCFRFTGNDVESFDEETLPSTLTTLKIKRLGNLKSLDYKGLHHLTSLRKLSIQGCPKLESISEQALPSSLEYLHVMTLEALDSMGLQHITSLRKLKIWNCPKLASLQGLPPSLECLQLWDQRGRDYKELQHLTSLRTLILKSPKLESLPEDMLPSSLENLEILNLEDLEYKGLRHLTSLRKLRISSSPKLESVPGEGLPSSLVSLQISDLRNLKSLNYTGLQHFTSLRKLLISHSPKLEFMPEEGLPSSLEYLKIIDCPLLATRCERETGENWPKISHISSIKISN